jgi:aminopeptidase N
LLGDLVQGKDNVDLEPLFSALRSTLETPGLDKHVVAISLSLPDEAYFVENAGEGRANVNAIVSACKHARTEMAKALGPVLHKVYQANKLAPSGETFSEGSARRALKNACLLAMQHDPNNFAKARLLAMEQFDAADNMTDRLYACTAVRDYDCVERKTMLEKFSQLHKSDNVTMNKWLSLQSRSALSNTLETVQSIMGQDVFAITNPSNCYALLCGFAHNMESFHDPEGRGYAFICDQIIKLDQINPQVGSRLAKTLTNWRAYSAPVSSALERELSRVAREAKSTNVLEVVNKSLKQPTSML